jgi:hypothetical protein
LFSEHVFLFSDLLFSVCKTIGFQFRYSCKELFLNFYLLLHCYWLYKHTNFKWFYATQSTKIFNIFWKYFLNTW